MPLMRENEKRRKWWLVGVLWLGSLWLCAFWFSRGKEADRQQTRPHQLAMKVLAEGDRMVALSGGYFLIYRKPHYLVCRLKPSVGKLEIVRVYRLRRDFLRYPSNPQEIALHGYYLEDISLPVRRRLEKLLARFRALEGKPAVAYEYTREAERLAEKIAALGGIGELMRFLERGVSFRLRRGAALALGKRGYVEAVPALLELLEQKDLEERKKALRILRDLTRLPLGAQVYSEHIRWVVKQVRGWLQKRSLHRKRGEGGQNPNGGATSIRKGE
ncbi:MAG: HEAT repeat domain-containing protein [Planctomycetota bacterium]|nr:MAG: HEAT repeat domain-containing protein [Planctomycetota bacterium]